MSKQAPPKIDFPCENYPIKILGEASENFRKEVLTIVEGHAPGFDSQRITTNDSRNGRFHSVTVFITATGIPQLEAIFEDLKKHPQTRMVL